MQYSVIACHCKVQHCTALFPQADKVDAYLHSLLIKTEPNRSHLACLGTWVLYHTLQTMINYTLAGFELELYAPYEYHYVYWYLSELLFAWLVSTLHRADNFLLEHETLSGMLAIFHLSLLGGVMSEILSSFFFCCFFHAP